MRLTGVLPTRLGPVIMKISLLFKQCKYEEPPSEAGRRVNLRWGDEPSYSFILHEIVSVTLAIWWIIARLAPPVECGSTVSQVSGRSGPLYHPPNSKVKVATLCDSDMKSGFLERSPYSSVLSFQIVLGYRHKLVSSGRPRNTTDDHR